MGRWAVARVSPVVGDRTTPLSLRHFRLFFRKAFSHMNPIPRRRICKDLLQKGDKGFYIRIASAAF